MKNKLENTILDKIYKFESKKTAQFLSIRLGLFLLFLIVSIGLVISVINQLVEQQTLDLLQIFQEDVATIKLYIIDVVGTMFEEFPKLQTAAIIGALLICLVIILTFIKNFGKIRNKLKILLDYWRFH